MKAKLTAYLIAAGACALTIIHGAVHIVAHWFGIACP